MKTKIKIAIKEFHLFCERYESFDMQPQITLHDPCQDPFNPREMMFLVKDKGSSDTQRFLRNSLSENAIKNMRENGVTPKSFEKLIFITLELKQSIMP